MLATPADVAVFGQHDEATLAQLRDVTSRAAYGAIMADGHLGFVMPIGGVVAYRNKVSVAGVGFDIACGNAAIRTDMHIGDILPGATVEDIAQNPYRIRGSRLLNDLADKIHDTISFGIGRKNNADDAPVDHALFQDPAWWLIPNTGPHRAGRDELMDKARRQLGTVGSGNHYVDVFMDERGDLWVGVHFGSRGLGHTIATTFMALSQGKSWWERPDGEPEALLDLGTQLGTDYWALMSLAGRYAYVGREWVARKVVSLLGAREHELVHNHHNFAWKEEHNIGQGFETLVVVRKGATPAFPGQQGFVGGSMGDNAVILEGTRKNRSAFIEPAEENDYLEIQDLQRAALFSTVHGAGRVMSRTAAAGKRHRKTGRLITPGRITPADMNDWLDLQGVILRGGGLDEAPQAYRRLPDVLKAQGPTVDIVHTLRPLIVVMAGADVYDPFKD